MQLSYKHDREYLMCPALDVGRRYEKHLTCSVIFSLF